MVSSECWDGMSKETPDQRIFIVKSKETKTLEREKNRVFRAKKSNLPFPLEIL